MKNTYQRAPYLHCVMKIIKTGQLVVPLEIYDYYKGIQSYTFYSKLQGCISPGRLVKKSQHSPNELESTSSINNRDLVLEGTSEQVYDIGDSFRLHNLPNQDRLNDVCDRFLIPPDYFPTLFPLRAMSFDTFDGEPIAIFKLAQKLNYINSSFSTDSSQCYFNQSIFYYLQDLEKFPSPGQAVCDRACTCDRKTLFASGCKCGFIKKYKICV